MKSIYDLPAIDTHMHLNHGTPYDHPAEGLCCSTYLDTLQDISTAAGITKLFCSTYASVLTHQVTADENEYLFDLSQQVDNLYQWVVIDPRNDITFQQADRMLRTEKCVGIKLHPECHGYELAFYADKLFTFASNYEAIVLIHPEMQRFPDIGPRHILPFADKYPHVTFIMAHMGDENWFEAIASAKHYNVYTDTSGFASSRNLVIEKAVSQIGADHILFGTDCYAAGMQRGRIDRAMIPYEDKEKILKTNAEKLFGILT